MSTLVRSTYSDIGVKRNTTEVEIRRSGRQRAEREYADGGRSGKGIEGEG